jgi:threonine/homoserine/homoserine lactone efflux protein
MNSIILALFLQGAALGVSAAASPGPMQTFLISETLIGGFKRSFPIAFAPLATDFPIVLLLLIVLIELPSGASRILNLVGGLYVLDLAWGLWRQWRAGAAQRYGDGGHKISPWLMLRRAVLMNFLNPNPYLFWGLVGGPILLGALDQSALHAGAFLSGMYGVFIGLQIALIAVFHVARRLGVKIVRGLLLISIAVLALFGGVLIARGVTG